MLIVTLSAAREGPRVPGAGRAAATRCAIALATRICDANRCTRRPPHRAFCFAPYLLQPLKLLRKIIICPLLDPHHHNAAIPFKGTKTLSRII